MNKLAGYFYFHHFRQPNRLQKNRSIKNGRNQKRYPEGARTCDL